MLYRHHKKMNMKTIIQLKTQQRLGGVPPRSERQPDRTSIPQNTVGADAINEQVQQLI